MNKSSLLLSLLLLTILGSCNSSCNKTGGETADSSQQQTATYSVELQKDTTLYGTSDEFGMSSFSLITEKGDTLEMYRDDEDGTQGTFIGDVTEGQRYAVTCHGTKDNLTVTTAINLTQLEKFTKDYFVFNGHLFLKDKEKAEPVDVLQLDDTQCTARGWSGKTYSFKK